jgi:hypothetical protein
MYLATTRSHECCFSVKYNKVDYNFVLPKDSTASDLIAFISEQCHVHEFNMRIILPGGRKICPADEFYKVCQGKMDAVM